MLVLQRKSDESIEVLDGKDGPVILKVIVVQVERGKVRLGLEADRRFVIRRSELTDLISVPDES